MALLLRRRLLVDPQQATADDVDKQERHVSRVEPVAQITCHDVEGAHRRGILRRCEDLSQANPPVRHISLQLEIFLAADTTGITL
ncbi:hypothetical protein [Nonomuraea recticatena]|uniref:Uncharacterized protein n=1 Tax=Nonomuraea recticatena TaxID=46178 RepID=A0ABP6EQR7_9ACTN